MSGPLSFRRIGAWLALLALGTQLVLSAGHVHLDELTLGTPAGGSGVSTAGAPVPHHDPAGVADFCDICASMAALASAVPPTPPVLPFVFFLGIAIVWSAASSFRPARRFSPHRSRAPPFTPTAP